MKTQTYMVRKLVSYFLRGLLFVGPIYATFYIIIISLQWVDRLIPIDIPGIGLLIVLCSVTLLGILASAVFSRPILEFFDAVLDKIPGINAIYIAVKDVVNAFAGGNKKFKNPVLVKLEANLDIKRIGFLTEDNLSKFGLEEDIAVYLPDSYGLTGNLYIVPRKHITPIQASSGEVTKFILTGGITSFKKSKEAEDV